MGRDESHAIKVGPEVSPARTNRSCTRLSAAAVVGSGDEAKTTDRLARGDPGEPHFAVVISTRLKAQAMLLLK